jgi:hypothetical protein
MQERQLTGGTCTPGKARDAADRTRQAFQGMQEMQLTGRTGTPRNARDATDWQDRYSNECKRYN